MKGISDSLPPIILISIFPADIIWSLVYGEATILGPSKGKQLKGMSSLV